MRIKWGSTHRPFSHRQVHHQALLFFLLVIVLSHQCGRAHLLVLTLLGLSHCLCSEVGGVTEAAMGCEPGHGVTWIEGCKAPVGFPTLFPIGSKCKGHGFSGQSHKDGMTCPTESQHGGALPSEDFAWARNELYGLNHWDLEVIAWTGKSDSFEAT